MPTPAETRRAIAVITLIFMAVAAAAVVMVRKRWHEPAVPRIHNIAVIPFKPVAGDPSNAVMETQILVAITTAIESSADLAVTPASRADAVLRGSIDTSDGRIRIVAHLWRVSDSRDIWQGRFDRPHEHVAALQQSIAEQVIEAAKMR